jgi:predicted phosphodiesterase
MARYSKILVIPDTHVEPGDKCERAVWIGRLIERENPSHIVHLGDLADMGSMSSYEVFKSSAYREDCASSELFLKLLSENGGDAWLRAKTVFLEGNHEARTRKFVRDHPELKGTLDLRDLGVYKYFDKVFEWNGGPSVFEHAGIMFAHYIQNRMGRAIGGVNHARSLLLNTMQSVVVGHSHTLHYNSVPLPNGRHIHGLVAGCCFEQEHEYAGQNNKRNWRGVAMLHDANRGEFDLELISIHRLKRDFQ